MKRTLKDALRSTPIESGTAFHEAIEDALERLPERNAPITTRHGWRFGRYKALSVALCALLVLCTIPLVYQKLISSRQGEPMYFSNQDNIAPSPGPGGDGGEEDAFSRQAVEALEPSELLIATRDSEWVPIAGVPVQPSDEKNNVAIDIPQPLIDPDVAVPMPQPTIEPETAVAMPEPNLNPSESQLSDVRLIIDEFEFKNDMVHLTLRLMGAKESDELPWLRELIIDGSGVATDLRANRTQKVQGGMQMRYSAPFLNVKDKGVFGVLFVLESPDGTLRIERLFRYNSSLQKIAFIYGVGEEAEEKIRAERENLAEPAATYRMIGLPDTRQHITMMLDTLQIYGNGLRITLLCDPPTVCDSLRLTNVKVTLDDEVISEQRRYTVYGQGGPDWPLGEYAGQGALLSQRFQLPFMSCDRAKAAKQIRISFTLSGNFADSDTTVHETFMIDTFKLTTKIDSQYIAPESENWLDDASFVEQGAEIAPSIKTDYEEDFDALSTEPFPIASVEPAHKDEWFTTVEPTYEFEPIPTVEPFS